MAEYILEILKSQLMVMFSWGPHNFKRLPNDEGLSFSVDGFKYQGCVKVIYNEGADLFEIYLIHLIYFRRAFKSPTVG